MLQTNFELGIWNACILYFIYFLVSITPFIYRWLTKKGKSKDTKKASQLSSSEFKTDPFARVLYWLSFTTFILVIIISIFLPLALGTIWLYVGIAVWIIGMIIIIMTINSWIKTPSDKLVTIGIYKYSRNPMYISMIFSHIGIGIACLSWVFLLITLVDISIAFLYVDFEEKDLIMKYGDNYHKYMTKTNRWIGRVKK
jgi:protein-S-isoprenylcysteine O-methyltransferase Ste14